MSIQRVPEVPFAQIANEALRDRRLSFKARGILALVLSHSGEWQAPKRWLATQSERDGETAIQSALNELTDLGYRSVRYERHGEQILTVVEWRHSPQVPCPSGNLPGRNPARHETGTASEHNPSEHNLAEHNKDNPRTSDAVILMDAYRDSNGAQTLVYGPLEASFEAFWDHYPRKAAKAAARKAFAKAIGKAKLAEIVEGARRYAADPNREAAYTCHASTWLNQERWGDPPLPAPSGRRTGGEARMDAYQRIHDNIGRPLIEVLAELEDGYEQP